MRNPQLTVSHHDVLVTDHRFVLCNIQRGAEREATVQQSRQTLPDLDRATVDHLAQGDDTTNAPRIDEAHPLFVGLTGIQEEGIDLDVLEVPHIETPIRTSDAISFHVADIVQEVVVGLEEVLHLVGRQIIVERDVEWQVVPGPIDLIDHSRLRLHLRIIPNDRDRDITLGRGPLEAIEMGIDRGLRGPDGRPIADPRLAQRVGRLRLDDGIEVGRFAGGGAPGHLAVSREALHCLELLHRRLDGLLGLGSNDREFVQREGEQLHALRAR